MRITLKINTIDPDDCAACGLDAGGNGDGCDECSTSEMDFPAVNEVCDRCQGTGGHDPEAFSSGFTSSEFAEMCDGDEDFEENYFDGRYDVVCTVCHGKNVVAVVDESRLTESERKAYQRHLDYQSDLADMRAEEAAERRMGC